MPVRHVRVNLATCQCTVVATRDFLHVRKAFFSDKLSQQERLANGAEIRECLAHAYSIGHNEQNEVNTFGISTMTLFQIVACQSATSA